MPSDLVIIDSCQGFQFAPWDDYVFTSVEFEAIRRGLVSINSPNHSYHVLIFIKMAQYADFEKYCHDNELKLQSFMWFKAGINYTGDAMKFLKAFEVIVWITIGTGAE